MQDSEIGRRLRRRPIDQSAGPSHTLNDPRQLRLPMEARSELLSPDEETAAEHGEVFTRRWVVELILDLVGYTSDRDLTRTIAVEPACGSGAFLVPMAERLLESARRHGRHLNDLAGSLQAVDLLGSHVAASRDAVARTLVGAGLPAVSARSLAASWISRKDFLLQSPSVGSVDLVVGNPPYIRLEAVPRERSDLYRRRCLTMGGRADVYIGFYEQGLHALRSGGTLGFICADRWMRNAYGRRLRELIATEWSLETVISMTSVDAFEDDVDAYPAITVIRRTSQESGPLVVEANEEFGPEDAPAIVRLADHPKPATRAAAYTAAKLPRRFGGSGGWPLGSPEQLSLIAQLEESFPTLEDESTGTRVGIGVATGADRVFIVRDAAGIEPERLLPLALARDVSSGRVEWSGSYLVNPWGDAGMIDLDHWPGTRAYLETHAAVLRKRHTAQRGAWFKTIDRVIPGLEGRSKLYLPDFKDALFPVLDRGATYPHHNLYWITSQSWDLRVLGGLLLSEIANLFIQAYSVRMRGGFLRFQAQYLRRIRLPRSSEIPSETAAGLAEAFEHRDHRAATQLALPLYGLRRLPPA